MVKLVNLTGSDCSIDSLCTILHPGESLEFMLSEHELMLAHPDIAEFVKRGYLAVLPLHSDDAEHVVADQADDVQHRNADDAHDTLSSNREE